MNLVDSPRLTDSIKTWHYRLAAMPGSVTDVDTHHPLRAQAAPDVAQRVTMNLIKTFLGCCRPLPAKSEIEAITRSRRDEFQIR